MISIELIYFVQMIISENKNSSRKYFLLYISIFCLNIQIVFLLFIDGSKPPSLKRKVREKFHILKI